ncbi:hypothetical protein DFW26_07650 [Clostridioides difficile]|nr:hypothetical protein [Clostridioides difficile]
MKIEIGESLLFSWLRHTKNCKLVQANWKPSMSSWELSNEKKIEEFMDMSSKYFKDKYNIELYKKNTSVIQLLKQAEIDVIGIDISKNNSQKIYALEVAFHELGLNYGDKNETATRVVKKIMRTAMCLYGYFENITGEIVFASPKVNNNILEILLPYLQDIKNMFEDFNFCYDINIIVNEHFSEKIMNPLIEKSDLISDTSELFMRSLQLYNLCDKNKETKYIAEKKQLQNIKPETNYYKKCPGMKIGEFVKKTLINLFENNKITYEEVEKMQTKEYSKIKFNLNYPLLSKQMIQDPYSRCWASPIEIYGENYFVCSQWVEKNNRYHFEKWLSLIE